MKEVRFRLNGIGYEAALKSLQEQFPYYIKKVDTKPTRDEELLEFTLDEGYVEPGRNRPTKVNAGYYGMKENEADQQGFLSASQMNYQRGKNTKKGAVPAAAAAAGFANEPAGGGAGTGGEEARRRQQLQDVLAHEGAATEVVEHAVTLRQDIRMGTGDNYVGGRRPTYMDMDDDRFRVWLNEEPGNLDRFNNFLRDNAEVWSREGEGGIGGFALKYQRYRDALGRSQPNPYSRDRAETLPPNPYTFSGPGFEGNAYHAGARPAEITAELRELDRSTNLLTTRKQLSELNDAEMRTEIQRLGSLRRAKESGHSFNDLMAVNRQYSPDAPSPTALESIFASDESMAKHLDKIHQARYLKSMQRLANTGPAAQPARGLGPTTPPATTGPTTPPRRGPATPTPAPGPTGPATGPTGTPSTPVVNAPGGGGPAQPNPATNGGQLAAGGRGSPEPGHV